MSLPMTNGKVKIYLTNNWSIIIEADFEQINNGDSWQAYKAERIVYVSTMTIKDKDNNDVLADTIREETAKPPTGQKQFSFEDKNRLGVAELKRDKKGWQLDSFMCTNGNLAACVINFYDESNLEWALEVWKSLSQD
jgi:hypothetical protein